jgi:hypothetical protein
MTQSYSLVNSVWADTKGSEKTAINIIAPIRIADIFEPISVNSWNDEKLQKSQVLPKGMHAAGLTTSKLELEKIWVFYKRQGPHGTSSPFHIKSDLRPFAAVSLRVVVVWAPGVRLTGL